MAIRPQWIGQEGDYYGSLVGPEIPDDYRDMPIKLNNLPGDVKQVSLTIDLGRTWNYNPQGSSDAKFIQAPGSTVGDLYLPANRDYQPNDFWTNFAVTYTDGAKQTKTETIPQANLGNIGLPSGQLVKANLRVVGKELAVGWVGQDANDWTGSGPGVGPDEFKDVHMRLHRLSRASQYLTHQQRSQPVQRDRA